MLALVFKEPHKPLTMVDLDSPVPSDGEVVLKMKCAALNHRDVWITKGLYPNLASDIVIGSDGVGEYEGKTWLINPNLHWGDQHDLPSDQYEILGMPHHGTFREFSNVAKHRLIEMPAHLNCEQGAALPLAGLTAYRVLFTRCRLNAGDKVCISGIGGGVALIAMQFALAAGAEVWVTSSSQAKIDQAVALGAAGGQLYTQDHWHKSLVKASGGFDVVIDSAGGPGFSALVSTCKKGGRIGIYGGSAGKIEGLSPQIIFWKHLSVFGSSMGSDQDFADMVAFVAENKIIPVVDAVYEFSDYQQAFDRMNAGEQFGKIVLKIS